MDTIWSVSYWYWTRRRFITKQQRKWLFLLFLRVSKLAGWSTALTCSSYLLRTNVWAWIGPFPPIKECQLTMWWRQLKWKREMIIWMKIKNCLILVTISFTFAWRPLLFTVFSSYSMQLWLLWKLFQRTGQARLKRSKKLTLEFKLSDPLANINIGLASFTLKWSVLFAGSYSETANTWLVWTATSNTSSIRGASRNGLRKETILVHSVVKQFMMRMRGLLAQEPILDSS